MTVSEFLLSCLQQAGVNQIFGVTGDALNTFVDAVRRQDKIRWIAMRHEENAAFAAYAEAALTGNLAVCAGTVGPGALHLLNGLYNAKKERVPVLAVSGQVSTVEIGSGYFQEVNLTKVYDEVCAFQAVIRSPEQAPRIILKAIEIALQERTVCRIELPIDIAGMQIKGKVLKHKIFRSQSKIIPSETEVTGLAELINSVETVTILAGTGSREAKAEVIALAELLNAPIVHTLKAADIFNESDPHVAGLTGLLGNPPGYKAVMEADLLLMLGTDFPYTAFLPQHHKIAQIDIRIENIGNRAPVDLGILGDMGETLRMLLPKVDPKPDTHFKKAIFSKLETWRKHIRNQSSLKRNRTPLHPQLFAHEIGMRASRDAIFTVDVGESTIWLARFVDLLGDRRLLGSFNHGSMAVAFPAALGAQSLNPKRQVWAFAGDGAFCMGMQDFVTAVRYNWPVKLIVFNNSELSFVKTEMEEAGLVPFKEALHLQNPNFADYARACGGEGIRVVHADEIVPAIEAAMRSDKPFLIEAMVSAGEISLPPTITAKEAWGFGGSKIREVLLAIKGDEDQWAGIAEELKSAL